MIGLDWIDGLIGFNGIHVSMQWGGVVASVDVHTMGKGGGQIFTILVRIH